MGKQSLTQGTSLRFFSLLSFLEVVINQLSFGGSDGGGKLLKRCSFDALYSLEGLEQGFGSLAANAFDVVELRVQGVFGTLVAVEGDGEAVDLILYLCKHTEKL